MADTDRIDIKDIMGPRIDIQMVHANTLADKKATYASKDSLHHAI